MDGDDIAHTHPKKTSPHIQTHIHAHTHTCTHTHTHTHTRTHTRARPHPLTHTRTQHTRTNSHTNTHVRTHTQICTYTVSRGISIYGDYKYPIIILLLRTRVPVASSFLYLPRQFCSVNVLSGSETRDCGTNCRPMLRRLDPSSCLSGYLKRTYLVNFSK